MILEEWAVVRTRSAWQLGWVGRTPRGSTLQCLDILHAQSRLASCAWSVQIKTHGLRALPGTSPMCTYGTECHLPREVG